MPLDGTNTIDETGAVILQALNVLRQDGWCIGARTNASGNHCAIGAFDILFGKSLKSNDFDDFEHPAIMRLARMVPKNIAVPDYVDTPPRGYPISLDAVAHRITTYNNSRASFTEIEDWFERAAIAL